jgi:hypothetical protein
MLEDPADFEKFERKINADYSPHTAVECAPVARLASLLWRLQRVTACESGLLQIQAEVRLENIIKNLESRSLDANGGKSIQNAAQSSLDTMIVKSGSNVKLDLARPFLRLADSERNIFERIGRYEANLWRQTAQAICLLASIGVQSLAPDKFFGRRFRSAKRNGKAFPPTRLFLSNIKNRNTISYTTLCSNR